MHVKKNKFNLKKSIYTTLYITLGLVAFIVITKLSLIYEKSFTSDSKKSLILSNYYKIQPLKLNISGSKGLFIKDTSSKVVDISLIFKGGSGVDPNKRSGMAYLMSSLLLKGSNGLSANNIVSDLKKQGVDISVSVDYDIITVNVRSLVEKLPKAFHLLDIILNKPNFSHDEIALAKQNIMIDLKYQDQESSVKGMNALYNRAFKKSKYFRNIEGSHKSIAKITRQELLSYKVKFFNKNNVIIGVSGNINKRILELKLNEILSKLPKYSQINEYYSLIPALNDHKVNILVQNATNVDIYYAFAMPNKKTKDYYSALVFNTYLGGGSGLNSLLMKQLRDKQGLVYTVSSSLQTSLYGNLWVIHAVTAANKYKEAINLIKSTLYKVVSNNNYALAIDQATKYLKGNYFLNFDNNTKRATLLGLMQLKGYSIKDIYNYNSLISSASSNSVSKVIKQYIINGKFLVIAAGKV